MPPTSPTSLLYLNRSRYRTEEHHRAEALARRHDLVFVELAEENSLADLRDAVKAAAIIWCHAGSPFPAAARAILQDAAAQGTPLLFVMTGVAYERERLYGMDTGSDLGATFVNAQRDGWGAVEAAVARVGRNDPGAGDPTAGFLQLPRSTMPWDLEGHRLLVVPPIAGYDRAGARDSLLVTTDVARLSERVADALTRAWRGLPPERDLEGMDLGRACHSPLVRRALVAALAEDPDPWASGRATQPGVSSLLRGLTAAELQPLHRLLPIAATIVAENEMILLTAFAKGDRDGQLSAAAILLGRWLQEWPEAFATLPPRAQGALQRLGSGWNTTRTDVVRGLERGRVSRHWQRHELPGACHTLRDPSFLELAFEEQVGDWQAGTTVNLQEPSSALKAPGLVASLHEEPATMVALWDMTDARTFQRRDGQSWVGWVVQSWGTRAELASAALLPAMRRWRRTKRSLAAAVAEGIFDRERGWRAIPNEWWHHVDEATAQHAHEAVARMGPPPAEILEAWQAAHARGVPLGGLGLPSAEFIHQALGAQAGAYHEPVDLVPSLERAVREALARRGHTLPEPGATPGLRR